MALFLTTEEVKKYIPVDASLNFNSIKMYINEAEEIFIKELLGEDMYDTLQADYTAGSGTPSNPDHVALLPYVQRPLAYFAMYLAVDSLAVNMGDAGVTQSRNDRSEPAPKWKVDKLRASYLNNSDIYAEKLLKFLEDNATPTKYNDWYASDANTIAEGLLVPTMTEAAKHIDISDRRLFRRMKKKIREIEGGLIKKLIGAEQYDELVTQIKVDSLKADTENTLLSEKLRPIIAKKALYEVIPMVIVGISDKGISIMSTNDSTVSKSPASKDEIHALLSSLRAGDTGYENDIQELKQFIIDNISDYPLIEESTAYTSRPDPGPKRPPANTSTSKHFSV